MKKSLSLFLSLVAVTVATVSCNKNESPPPSSSDAMIGLWELETFNHTSYGTTSEDIPYNPYDCPDKNFFDLKPAGVLQVGDVDKDCVLSKSDGTWTANYGVLRLDDGVQYRIISVTSSTLILRNNFSSDEQQYITYTFLKK